MAATMVDGTRRRVGRLATVALATVASSLALVGLSASPAAAADTTWRPAAGSVPNATTYAYLVSSPGTVGNGGTYAYTSANSDVAVQVVGGRISFGIEGDDSWGGVLQPPTGVSTVVKGAQYVDLPRSNTGGSGNISVTGPGSSCNRSESWYVVDDVTYSGGQVQTLLVRFEQRCVNFSGLVSDPLRGQIRYDRATPAGVAPTPIRPIPTVWAPAAGATPATGDHLYLASQSGDFIGGGSTRVFTGDDVVQVEGGGARLRFDADVDDEFWTLEAAASNRADGLTSGYYSDLQRYPFHNPVRGGFSISGNGRGCNTSSSWLAIDEIDPTLGVLSDVTLRFEQRCENATAGLRGRLRWTAPGAVGSPGLPTAVSATPESRGATVRWTAPTSTGSGAITGYEVIVYEQGTVTRAPIPVAASARSLTIGDLPLGVPHTFKVRAVNGSGAGTRSAATASVLPLDPRPAVAALSPTSGPRTGGTTVSVTGTSLGGATGVTVGGVAATFTQVSTTRIDLVTPALSAGSRAVVVTTPEGASASTSASTFTALQLPPGAPTGVAGVPGPNSIAVSWTAPAFGGDGGTFGYEVSATKVGSLSPEVTLTTGSTARTASLTGLTAGASYVVKVTASSAAGKGPAGSSAPVAVPLPDVGPFAGVAALVRQQYLDFAGRPATTAEVNDATAPILRGSQTPEGFVASMHTRAEWAGTRAPVVRLYAAYFDRLPDMGGLTYWAEQVRTGTSLAKVSATFAASREFVNKYGALSNRNFVLRIYANVLKRTPDAGGVNFWTGKLDQGTSRGVVMNNFSESSENKRTTGNAVAVVLLHAGMLRTVPSAGVLAEEVAALDGGAPLSALARRLLDSAAYAARFGA